MSLGDATSTGLSSRASAEDFTRTITAFFDTRDHADQARRDLIQAGIPDADITVTGNAGNTAIGTTAAGQPEGFWESLKELFMPEEDRYAYAEGIRRGGYLLSVRSDTATHDRIMDILDRDGAVDMDQRESSWRNEGWTGYTGRDALSGSDASYTAPSDSTAGFAASSADLMPPVGSAATPAGGIAGESFASRASSAETAGTYAASAPGIGASSASRTAAALGTGSSVGTGDLGRGVASDREETIPVVEEEVRIGKRDVNRGRVRVRSYVVETPVQENVNLRSESVQVERRPVDRPATEADRLFKDRTIEAEQYSEEAVIQKEARVREEIALRKTVDQRTETVSDTVRRTEVEVEDERGNAVSPTPPRTDRKI